MAGKFLFLVGGAVGYVLGARAGRDRYETMKAQADALWHDPRVQDSVERGTQMAKDRAPDLQAKVAGAASQAAHVVKDKAPDVSHKLSDAAQNVRGKSKPGSEQPDTQADDMTAESEQIIPESKLPPPPEAGFAEAPETGLTDPDTKPPYGSLS